MASWPVAGESCNGGLGPVTGRYRLSIRGEVPPDLSQRISGLHATAIHQPAGTPEKSQKPEEKPAGEWRDETEVKKEMLEGTVEIDPAN